MDPVGLHTMSSPATCSDVHDFPPSLWLCSSLIAFGGRYFFCLTYRKSFFVAKAKLTSLQEETFFTRPSVHFPIPDLIKGYLVDDWENITKTLVLVELPSQAPVNWIMQTYCEEEKGKRMPDSADANRLVETVEGMKVYFEKMLGKTLLYKFEREQYAKVSERSWGFAVLS